MSHPSAQRQPWRSEKMVEKQEEVFKKVGV